jgi:hypothetical protein
MTEIYECSCGDLTDNTTGVCDACKPANTEPPKMKNIKRKRLH